jgi:flagellar biosynthesis/type III secretory pathway chaperone
MSKLMGEKERLIAELDQRAGAKASLMAEGAAAEPILQRVQEVGEVIADRQRRIIDKRRARELMQAGLCALTEERDSLYYRWEDVVNIIMRELNENERVLQERISHLVTEFKKPEKDRETNENH